MFTQKQLNKPLFMNGKEFDNFFTAVKTLRKAQKRYFNTKSKEHLIWALDAEKRVDKLIDIIETGEIRNKNIYDKVDTKVEHNQKDLFIA